MKSNQEVNFFCVLRYELDSFQFSVAVMVIIWYQLPFSRWCCHL